MFIGQGFNDSFLVNIEEALSQSHLKSNQKHLLHFDQDIESFQIL